MWEVLGRGHAAGRDPSLRTELTRIGTPDSGVRLHGCEWDVEDLPGLDLQRGERPAVRSADRSAQGNDVVFEYDAFGVRGSRVQTEADKTRQRTLFDAGR